MTRRSDSNSLCKAFFHSFWSIDSNVSFSAILTYLSASSFHLSALLFNPSLKGLIPFCPWKNCRTDHSLLCLQAWSRTLDEELCLRADTCSLPLECMTRDGKDPLHPTWDRRAPPLATPAFPWYSVLQSDAECGPWPQHGTTLQKCQTQAWMYVYTTMYIYIKYYVYILRWKYICTYVHIHVDEYINIHIYIYVYLHVYVIYMYMYICISIRICCGIHDTCNHTQ